MSSKMRLCCCNGRRLCCNLNQGWPMRLLNFCCGKFFTFNNRSQGVSRIRVRNSSKRSKKIDNFWWVPQRVWFKFRGGHFKFFYERKISGGFFFSKKDTSKLTNFYHRDPSLIHPWPKYFFLEFFHQRKNLIFRKIVSTHD